MTSPFVLAARDLAILQSLADVRYLTAQQLAWMQWPTWWRAMEQAVRDRGAPRREPRLVRRRLQVLAQQGLIIGVTRTIDRAVTSFHRIPNGHALTQAGAALLAAHHPEALPVHWLHERAKRAASTLEHSLAIGAFYAALRAESSYRAVAFTAWAADHVLCRDYDSVTVAQVHHPLPVLADASFVLDGTRCFLEIDRGTTSAEQWRKRALGYQAYLRDPKLSARYGVTSFLVLVVAPTQGRVAAIARAIASACHGHVAPYRFLLEERVHPFQIRRRWQQVSHVELPTRPGGIPTIQFTETVLWTPRSDQASAEPGELNRNEGR